MEELRRFNGDRHTRAALIAYIQQFIAEEAVQMMYDRKDVSHIVDAKELIDKAFTQLDIDYGIKQQQQIPINDAR